MADYFIVFRSVSINEIMAVLKRNALLKELSRKLEDQNVHQSSVVSHTIPDASGVIRTKTWRKNRILMERSRNLTETLVPNPK